MGTEVLRPQDCLIHQRIRVAPVVFPRRKTNYGYVNGQNRAANVAINGGNRKVQIRPEQRRRSPEPAVTKRSASVGDFKTRSNQVEIGQVTILRRGELIDWKEQAAAASSSVRRNGEESMSLSGTSFPEMVLPKQIRMSPPSSGAGDTYAGSAFSLSPSPRALPLPSFFNRKSSPHTVDDSATKDLRRLLRLE